MGAKRFRRVAALAAVAVIAGTVAGLGSSASASHSWGGYHWARTQNPFTLQLGDNVSAAWDPHLVTTSSDWSVSTVLDTTIAAGNTRAKVCRASSGTVQVCNAAYGRTGWLGVAQVWVSGSHITQGTVKMNDTYFGSAPYNTTAWRNLVMCQEVGHTLGLDHQDEIFDNPNLGTCMDYTQNPATNQHPNQHDYDQLATIYQHLDSTTTLSAPTAGAAARATVDVPGAWGRLVSGSENPRSIAVYENDLDSRGRVVTFVIWA